MDKLLILYILVLLFLYLLFYHMKYIHYNFIKEYNTNKELNSRYIFQKYYSIFG
jgi:hypothetical protein